MVFACLQGSVFGNVLPLSVMVGESNLTPQFISYVDSLTCVSSSVNAIVALPSMEHL